MALFLAMSFPWKGSSPWIFGEYPMKGIPYGPWKLQNKISWLYFWPWIFLRKLALHLATHAFYTKRQLWALNFPWKLVTEYFMGHETMGSEMTSWGINLSWIPSRYISWVMKRFWWSFQWPWMWLGLYPSVSWAINYPETPYMIFKLAHGS